jgi:hypothetical protein
MAFAAGQTAIIIPVGAAEPIVGRWHRQFDPAAAAGVPAHVTVIYPFLSEQDLDEDAAVSSPTFSFSSPTPMTRFVVLPPRYSSAGQTPRRTLA